MDFAYDTEQDEFRASLRRFLADHCPSERARAVDGHDAKLWGRLCTELGVCGLHVPGTYGGGGFSLIETAVVAEELGRAIAPVPAFASLAAIEAILRAGSEMQRTELLPGLLAGERIGALGLAVDTDLDPSGASVTAATEPNGVRRLAGVCPVVLHGHAADLLMVPAVTDGAVRLHVVDTAAEGVHVTRLTSLDLTRPVASVRLDGAEAAVLDAGAGELDTMLDVIRVLLAAELLGVAEASLDAAVGHARQRLQFNRPIGSFQAVKHQCSEVAVEIDATRAAVMYAAMAASEDSPDLAEAAVLAKAQAADTAVLATSATIQILGGIGFTWEHDAHLYYRRAMSGAALLGSTARHRDLLAQRVGIVGELRNSR